MRFYNVAEWLAWQESLHPTTIDLGLERLHRTLGRLNWRAPECPILTVGGTNGKGSTVALIRRILSAAGYRVGAFTSPHLIRYNERITIAEREISDASLVAAFERIDAARGEDTLTFFEFNTLAALLTFATAGLDAIVLEVGMGGRLDAVNIVDADVAVICTIALDHCEWLGNTVEQIGREKAGILRFRRPAILGAREMPESLMQIAGELEVDLSVLGRDFGWQLESPEAWSWQHRGEVWAGLPMPALHGRVQLDNASTALAALAAISDRLSVSREAIAEGLATVSLAGRFQVMEWKGEWILDVAHNPAAAKTLAQQLGELRPKRPTIAVCGVLGDKDAAGIASALRDCFDGWLVAQLDSPRSISATALAERLHRAGVTVCGTSPSIEAACEHARELAGPTGRVVIFGSFLAVGPALRWLEARCVTLT